MRFDFLSDLMQVDLLTAKLQCFSPCSERHGCHPKHSLIETTSRPDISHGQDEMIQ